MSLFLPNAVSSVNDQTGDVIIAKSDVGLSNVDNTSDANKPISTATQTALDAKASIVYVDNQVTGNQTNDRNFAIAMAIAL